MNIVLVDPSRVIHRIIERIVVARGDDFHAFTSGQEAVAYLQHNDRIDLLITSLELTDMDGIELCWLARAGVPGFASRQIIAMSSADERRGLTEALDAGADDYLELPFCEREFLARLRSSERVITSQREIQRMATIDDLTGVLNRRAFLHKVEVAVANMALEIPTSLAIIDIDHFKSINDTHGHDVGDMAIRAVCACFDNAEGVFGRLGGEEFGWLLAGFEAQAAHEACDDARRRIAALRLDAHGCPLRLTASFGVTDCRAGDAVVSILKRADIALYAAKDSGRDRVVLNKQAELEALPA